MVNLNQINYLLDALEEGKINEKQFYALADNNDEELIYSLEKVIEHKNSDILLDFVIENINHKSIEKILNLFFYHKAYEEKERIERFINKFNKEISYKILAELYIRDFIFDNEEVLDYCEKNCIEENVCMIAMIVSRYKITDLNLIEELLEINPENMECYFKLVSNSKINEDEKLKKFYIDLCNSDIKRELIENHIEYINVILDEQSFPLFRDFLLEMNVGSQNFERFEIIGKVLSRVYCDKDLAKQVIGLNNNELRFANELSRYSSVTKTELFEIFLNKDREFFRIYRECIFDFQENYVGRDFVKILKSMKYPHELKSYLVKRLRKTKYTYMANSIGSIENEDKVEALNVYLKENPNLDKDELIDLKNYISGKNKKLQRSRGAK